MALSKGEVFNKYLKFKNKIYTEANLHNVVELTDEEEELKGTYVNDMRKFFIDFWDYAMTQHSLIPGISFDCLCEHLKYVMTGELKNVIFVFPPREAKTTLLSVIFPAYLWTINPKLGILSATYSSGHAKTANKNMQFLMQSDPYQRLYGMDFDIIKKSADSTTNNKNGIRFASSFDGHMTGMGGSYILIDDANNLNKIQYKSHRDMTNNFFDNVLYYRRNKFSESHIIVAMHRSHNEDLIGHILSKEDPSFLYVNIPFEYEVGRRHVSMSQLTNKVIWEDPRTKEGELLSPGRYTQKDVADMKLHVGKREYRSLYQGDPSFDQGGIFQKDWFQVWKRPFLPKFQFIIQGWDTAMSTTAHACHSASITFGVFEDEFKKKNIMLLNLWYGKLEFTELFEMIRRQATNYNCTDLESELKYMNSPDVVVLETKANGKPLLDLLKRAGLTNIIGYNPPPTASRENDPDNSGKVIRARMQSGIVESGRVYLRARPESYTSLYASSQSFLNAACNFPNDIEASRDIIDVFTMILSTLRSKGILRTDLEMSKKGSVLRHMLPEIHVLPKDRFNDNPNYLRSINMG